jgi:hypothetical protein
VCALSDTRGRYTIVAGCVCLCARKSLVCPFLYVGAAYAWPTPLFAVFLPGFCAGSSKATARMYSGVAQWSDALARLSVATQGLLSSSGGAGIGLEDPFAEF